MSNNYATICFAIIYNNNENDVLKTLESVYSIIDRCIILNTDSSNSSYEKIRHFFEEKNILLQLYNSDEKDASKSKTKLFELCYGHTDFILHLEPGEILNIQNLNTFEKINMYFDSKKMISYNVNVYETIPYIDTKVIEFKKYTIKTNNKEIVNVKPVLFNNKYKWKVAGNVFQKYIPINIDELDCGYILNTIFNVTNNCNENMGNKDKIDSNILLLKKDYLDTINLDEHGINSLCIFNLAQNYYYLQQWNKALLNYLKYTKLKDAENDELFESYMKIVQIMYVLDYNVKDLIRYTVCATQICNERAEPYYQLGCIFNENSNYELGYFNLKKAQTKNLEEIYKKSMKFIDESCYGTNINYQLALSCLHTDRKDEGIELLNNIEKSRHDENEISYLKKLFHEI
jgi:hypothetical protein